MLLRPSCERMQFQELPRIGRWLSPCRPWRRKRYQGHGDIDRPRVDRRGGGQSRGKRFPPRRRVGCSSAIVESRDGDLGWNPASSSGAERTHFGRVRCPGETHGFNDVVCKKEAGISAAHPLGRSVSELAAISYFQTRELISIPCPAFQCKSVITCSIYESHEETGCPKRACTEAARGKPTKERKRRKSATHREPYIEQWKRPHKRNKALEEKCYHDLES